MRRIPTLLMLLFVLTANIPFHVTASTSVWWNDAYKYRRMITISTSVDLPPGYTVGILIDHAKLVSQTKSRADGNDIRILYWNGASWKELDRIIDPDLPENGWNKANTRIIFRTEAPIAAGGKDNNYYIYYGNPSAEKAPSNEAKVYAYFNSMDSTSGLIYFGDNDGNPTMSIISGRVKVYVDDQTRANAGWRDVNSPILSDFEMLIDVEIAGPESAARAGPVFRQQSDGAGYIARIKPSVPDWRISAVDSKADYIAMTDQILQQSNFDVNYRFKVRMVGWTIKFWFRTMTGSYQSSPLTYTVTPNDPQHYSGKFGIWIEKAPNGVYFDNMRVRRLVEPEPMVTLGPEEQSQLPEQPLLDVKPTTIDFGGSTTTLSFNINNIGIGTLQWQIKKRTGAYWIESINPETGINNATVLVKVSRAGLLPGTYSEILDVMSNGGNKTVHVRMSVSDIYPPSILSIIVQEIGPTSATVAWTTDEASDSQVEYGTTSSYGMITSLNSTLDTNHKVVLTGLTPSTTYHFRVRSRDSSGNLAISTDNTFITSSSTIPTVGMYEIFEITLSTSISYSNPYKDVVLNATFMSPSGRNYAIEGFWDGGNIWKIRFAGIELGTWSYKTYSNDKFMNSRTGKFEVVNSNKKGFITKNPRNPYTFMYTNGEPFFWMGETSKGLFSDYIPLDGTFQAYIDRRASQKFNNIHALLDNDIGGITTFLNQDRDRINPDYFKYVDAKINYIVSKGMAVGLFLTWAQSFVQFSRSQFERYERYVIARYAAYNVYWVITGEFEEESTVEEYRYHGKTIDKYDPFDHLISIHTVDSNNEFANDEWLGYIMHQKREQDSSIMLKDLLIQLGRNDIMIVQDVPCSIADGDLLYSGIQSDRKFSKPVVNAEFGYEQYDGWTGRSGRTTPDTVRRLAWSIVMAGGFFTYGMEATYKVYEPNNGRIGWKLPERELGGSDFMKLLYEFMTRTEFWKMIPDKSVSSRGMALSNRGYEYVIYMAKAESVNVDLRDASGLFHVEWYDPTNGNYLGQQKIEGGSWKSFNPPAELSGRDAVLYIKREDFNTTTTLTTSKTSTSSITTTTTSTILTSSSSSIITTITTSTTSIIPTTSTTSLTSSTTRKTTTTSTTSTISTSSITSGAYTFTSIITTYQTFTTVSTTTRLTTTISTTKGTTKSITTSQTFVTTITQIMTNQITITSTYIGANKTLGSDIEGSASTTKLINGSTTQYLSIENTATQVVTNQAQNNQLTNEKEKQFITSKTSEIKSSSSNKPVGITFDFKNPFTIVFLIFAIYYVLLVLYIIRKKP